MSGPLAGAAAYLAGLLSTAGVRASADPRSYTPPMVAVTPTRAERVTHTRTDVTLELACIAPGPANLDALEAIDALALAVTGILDAEGLPWRDGTVTTLANGPAGEPLLIFAILLTLPWEV